jgi:hypothetical protein
LQLCCHSPSNLGITKSQLRFLPAEARHSGEYGGRFDNRRLCHADTDNPSAPAARYFVIHDTSFKLKASETFDPAFINTTNWSGNRLATLPRGKTHIYITRLGQTLTDKSYLTPWRATQFELKPNHTRFRDCSCITSWCSPARVRAIPIRILLILVLRPSSMCGWLFNIVIASVRRGNWMVPTFHCVLDLGVGTHDDPQRFDLAAWGAALDDVLAAVRAERNATPSFTTAATAAQVSFSTPAASSITSDRKGGSTTSGLQGQTREPAPGIVVIDRG